MLVELSVKCSGTNLPGLSGPSAEWIWVDIVFIVLLCYALTVLSLTHLDRILQKVTSHFHISPEVAGITFLALGGSLPELAIHLFAAFKDDEIGVAAVLGSGTYNLTFGLALTCFVASRRQQLNVFSLARDSTFYVLSIGLFALFSRDDKISLPECIMLLLFYPYYLLFVASSQVPQKGITFHQSKKITLEEKSNGRPDSISFHERLSFPFTVLFKWTVPDRPGTLWLLGSFAVVLGYVVFLAYWIMRFVERVGCSLHVDAAVLGMIFLAIGTSLPDTILMAVVSYKGHPAMAVSGLIGSNIFDLLIGLGGPWLVRQLWKVQSFTDISNSHIKGLQYILVSIVIVFLLSVSFTQFSISWHTGVMPLLAYFVYVVLEVSYF